MKFLKLIKGKTTNCLEKILLNKELIKINIKIIDDKFFGVYYLSNNNNY
jgi:hypothetical protein